MLKAILAIGVAAFSLSGVDGQATPDRTTEKGESSIKGELYISPYIVGRGEVSTTSMRLCMCSCNTLGLPNDVNPSFECVRCSYLHLQTRTWNVSHTSTDLLQAHLLPSLASGVAPPLWKATTTPWRSGRLFSPTSLISRPRWTLVSSDFFPSPILTWVF